MVKRRISLALVIAMVMTMLQAVVPAYAAATAIDYVSIDRSNGLNVGNVLEAVPTFTGEADGSEAVSYQWKRIKIENKIVGKDSKENNPYVSIPGATGKTYTISNEDAGYILKVEATYNGTVLSGDCVAVGNILSSYSQPALESYSFKRFQNVSTSADTYEIGDLVYDETTKAHGGILNDSNNADLRYNYAYAGSTGGYGYFGFQGGQIVVTESTLAQPVELESVLLESGYPNKFMAIPNVYVQVMYENETEYKNWSANTDWGVTRAEAEKNQYKRYFFHHIKANADMVGADAGKKVKAIKVVVCPKFGTVATDNVYIREISAFAYYESTAPEIKAVDGFSFDETSVTDVTKGTKVSALLDAITANAATESKMVVGEDRDTEIDADSYVKDGMFVKLSSVEGESKYYEIKNAQDVFSSDFNDYTGKKAYRVNNVAKGDALPKNWNAVYSVNPEAAATDKAEAKMYVEGVYDSVKETTVGHLVNKDETLTTDDSNFQLARTGLDESLTKGNIVAVEANVMVGTENASCGMAVVVGSQTVSLLSFTPDNTIKVFGNSVRKYEANVWYNILAVLNIAEKKVSCYINGVAVRDNMSYNFNDITKGITRINMTYTTYENGEARLFDYYFDDVKIYNVADATYKGLNNTAIPDSKNVKMTGVSSGLAYVANNHLESVPTVKEVIMDYYEDYDISVINPDGSMAAYDDVVTEDMRIVFKNYSDESAFRMFAVEYKEFYMPTYYANNRSITAIKDETLISAKSNVGATDAVMAVLVYDGNSLVDIALAEKKGNWCTADISLEGIANPRLESMLFTDMDTLVPMLSGKCVITK